MQRYFPVFALIVFSLILSQAGCGGSAVPSIQADNEIDKTLSAFDKLLKEFKTVTDDQSAKTKLASLNGLYDALVKQVHELEEAQKKNYVTGGDVSAREKEVGEFREKFGKEFSAHRDSLTESTITILGPFFAKLANGPIR